MNTRGRFRKYIEMEKLVAEKVRQLADLGGTITRIVPVAQGKLYDRIVVLEGGREIKLEIQITESGAWKDFGDVRLDLISAFRWRPVGAAAKYLRIHPEEVPGFLSSIRVQRYGKLYECEAETLAFYVTKPTDLLWIFSMKSLQDNREYFVSRYGILINRKGRDETWQSCFVAVPKSDPALGRCGVQYDLRGGE